MKKLAFFLGCLLLVSGCRTDYTPLSPNEKSEYTSLPLTSEQKQVIETNNAFAFNLFAELNQETPTNNLFISPFSVSMALGMVLNGANGETYTAIQNTLGFENLDETAINSSYAYLYQNLQDLDPNVVFEIANSIWCRQGVNFLPEFLKVNQTYFNAQVHTINFADPQAVITINNWIADATHDKIQKVLDTIPQEAVMYLINALYFNGIWTYQFPEDKVMTKPFYTFAESPTQCQMMYVTCRVPILVNNTLTVAVLPYGSGNYTMTLIMPRTEEFNSFLQTFNLEKWQEIQTLVHKDSCTIGLPKFRFGFRKLLNSSLKKMGMEIAFDAKKADFSRISQDLSLKISRVIHQTFVEVSEKGTEAAAVTIVEMVVTSTEGPNIVPITFDHPFVFVISEKSTGTILFMGKVLQPVWD